MAYWVPDSHIHSWSEVNMHWNLVQSEHMHRMRWQQVKYTKKNTSKIYKKAT